MKLSIIIPVFNEERTVGLVLEKLLSVSLPCRKEIIVVDDGSTDNTLSRITYYVSRIKYIKLIKHRTNLGKGAAIRNGIKHATGDYILIQDADLEYDPSEIPKLLSPLISKPTTDNRFPVTGVAVYGSRFLNGTARIPLLYLLGNKFLTALTNILYGTHLTDMETGYKLIPATILKKIHLTSRRFDIEPEITIQLIRHRIPIEDIPITYKGRPRILGKKITFIDAFSAIRNIITMAFQ
jgi:dolichol-phosphate mannosyltransferase